MYITREIHPVGQGAFYTEKFIVGGKDAINVVYDCGTIGFKLVDSEIDVTFQEDEVIEAVFISHLDGDHISGLPHLLERCRVKRVFFPLMDSETTKYIDIYNRLFVDTYDVEKSTVQQKRFLSLFAGNMSDAFELLGLPEGHIPRMFAVSTEEVERITETQGENRLGRTFSERKENVPSYLELEIYTDIENRVEDNGITYVKSGEVLGEWNIVNSAYQWMYKPFNINRKSNVKKLYSNLKKDFTGKITYERIVNIVSQKGKTEEKKKLWKAYCDLPGGINANSMTVYSGNSGNFIQYRVCPHQKKRYRAEGALYLGDYNAKTTGFGSLKKAYSKYWYNIGCIQLPHHGSIMNFNSGFLRSDAYFFASADPNNKKYKHPSKEVRKQLKGRDFNVANKNKKSIIEYRVIGIKKEFLSNGILVSGESYDDMISDERICEDLRSNITAREVFEYLCADDVVVRMIAAVVNGRPPFEAVVEGIEAICEQDDTQLDLSHNNRWRAYHCAMGKMVSYVLAEYNIYPVRINNNYSRKKLRKGTKFKTATVFRFNEEE